jgi:hypothetical protein
VKSAGFSPGLEDEMEMISGSVLGFLSETEALAGFADMLMNGTWRGGDVER